MSLSIAFGLSRSGLNTVEKWAELTSSNVANADKPGYTRKSVLRSTDETGVVRVNGIRREADGAIDRLHRTEISKVGRQDAIASGSTLYLTELGMPDDPNGLANRLADLETAFVQLANAPEQVARQSAALMSSEALARDLRAADGALNGAKVTIQGRVEAGVDAANIAVAKIAELNQRIMEFEVGTKQHTMVSDDLNVQLDQLAELADTRVVFDAAGRATVYTAEGTPLVEGESYELLTFEAATSSIYLGSNDITPGRSGTRGFSEGRIAGDIELLGEVIPQAQRQLDELARGLIVGFETADTSLGGTLPGLFTDDGAVFDPLNLEGLAGRITVNDAVKPTAGGDLWRIRDGVGAAVEGPLGNNVQAEAFVQLLEGRQVFDGTAGLGTDATLGDYASQLITFQQTVRTDAEGLQETFSRSASALETTRSGLSGVDIDDELQQLILIEQSYAANSRVITVVSEMIETLLNAV